MHPIDDGGSHELYLMCDDVHTTVAELEAKGVEFAGPVSDQECGLVAVAKIPGGQLALYEPRHPTAVP